MTKRLSLRTIGLILTDILIIYGGMLFALFLRLGLDGTTAQLYENNGWLKISLATFICLLTLHLYDLYDYTVINNRHELLLRLIQALGSAWALLAVLFYFVPTLVIGRGVLIFSIIITLVLLLALRSSIHFLTGHPEFGEKILIIGEGDIAIDTAEAVLARRDAGYRIIGFITEDFEAVKARIPTARYLGSINDLESIILNEKIDRLVIGLRERRGSSFPAETLLRISLAGQVSIEEGTSFYERITGRVHLDMLRPSWFIFSGRKRATALKMFFREAVSRFLATVGLVFCFPIAVFIAILIKLDSKGEVFYRQERVGKNGHIFKVIKFRSMRSDAEADGNAVWAVSDDERTTRVGRIIRKMRVDEIPQFWNIIKGEMSFVGPRPERPQFVSQLSQKIRFYEHRHLFAPGLTGWAQINYPYGASVEDARQKLQFDLYYIKNQTLTLDLIIVFETIKIILFGKGAR